MGGPPPRLLELPTLAPAGRNGPRRQRLPSSGPLGTMCPTWERQGRLGVERRSRGPALHRRTPSGPRARRPQGACRAAPNNEPRSALV
jgi:hypothetical protein